MPFPVGYNLVTPLSRLYLFHVVHVLKSIHFIVVFLTKILNSYNLSIGKNALCIAYRKKYAIEPSLMDGSLFHVCAIGYTYIFDIVSMEIAWIPYNTV